MKQIGIKTTETELFFFTRMIRDIASRERLTNNEIRKLIKEWFKK
ncbi:hypothetical protein ES703_18809 [subsurface metagenome]